jgi:hypothetical protein
MEINTKNIGAERDFYGPELDARITALETRFGALAGGLRLQTGLVLEPDIAAMVAHLTLRTRALRQSAIALATNMTDRMRDHFSQSAVLKAAVRKKMPNPEILKWARDQLAEQGLKKHEIEKRILMAGPSLLKIWEQSIEERAEEMAPVVDEAMREAKKGHAARMRVSFIEALSRGLDDNPRIKAYRQLNWFVLPTAESLILGDSVCVFEVDGERPFKPWDDEASPGKRTFLPLSPCRLLIGSREQAVSAVDLRAINSAFARCSLEFFVSAKRVDDPDMIASIGRWSGIASNTELNAVWEQIKNDF